MADQPQSIPPANLPQRPVMPPPITVAPMPRPSMPPPMAPRPPVAPVPAPRPPAPPITAPTPPPAAPGEPYTSDLRTMSADIGRISTGQAVMGAKLVPPPAPTSPVVPRPLVTPVTPPAIAIPPTSGGSSGGRKVLTLVGVLAAIGLIFWLVSIMFGGGSTTEVSPTPTPSPVATLSTSAKSLSAYFPQTTAPDTSTFPASISGGITGSWVAVSYAQTEQFDADGKSVTNGNPGPRTILIAQVSDASKANQAMMAWEATIASEQKTHFGIDPTKASTPSFAGGSYNQIGVRYQNFPYADMSIDWAIVTASNNKNYLVISGSRQAMFFAIDQLMR